MLGFPFTSSEPGANFWKIFRLFFAYKNPKLQDRKLKKAKQTKPNLISTIQSITMPTDKKKILLCGGGNAIHVLTAYIGSRDDCDVAIFSTFPGEADRIAAAMPEEGIRCINDLGPDKYGKPVKISDKAEEVVPGSDMIILAIPSFTHELYLRAVAPHVKPGVVIGAMPGEGGFDMCARHVFGAEFVDQSNVWALETLPWACRIMVRVAIFFYNLFMHFIDFIIKSLTLLLLLYYFTGIWKIRRGPWYQERD